MFTGSEIVQALAEIGVTDVIWLPDSSIGPWEEALEKSEHLRLIRICREGEAWPLAAGLHLGGRRPIVIMQSTGFFESGDALRNVVFDLALPIFAIVGVRNGLVPDSRDSAKRFAEPIVQAWQVPYVSLLTHDDKPLLAAHYRQCQAANQAGIVLLAEGPP